MWEPTVPDVSENLRQGDLLRDLHFRPGVDGGPGPAEYGVVIENCCTLEQRAVVLLARVGRRKRPKAGSTMEAGLMTFLPEPGLPYTPYEHVLDTLDPHLSHSNQYLRVAKLTERLHFGGLELVDLAWLNQLRVARMTVLARVQLRARIAQHFGRAVAEDTAWLEEHGYDGLGRPKPTP